MAVRRSGGGERARRGEVVNTGAAAGAARRSHQLWPAPVAGRAARSTPSRLPATLARSPADRGRLGAQCRPPGRQRSARSLYRRAARSAALRPTPPAGWSWTETAGLTARSGPQDGPDSHRNIWPHSQESSEYIQSCYISERKKKSRKIVSTQHSPGSRYATIPSRQTR